MNALFALDEYRLIPKSQGQDEIPDDFKKKGAMIKQILSGCAICILAMISWANSSVKNEAVKREVSFEACHFRMNDPYGGTLTAMDGDKVANYYATINPKASHLFDTWIQFSCRSATDTKAFSELAGIRMTSRGWAIDPQSGYPDIKGTHTTFHSLHGKGWNGGGVTMDDTNGDEVRRIRTYGFCISHEQIALCGMVQHVGYLQHLNESVLPQVIKMLNSIEFVDDPSMESANSLSSL
ncbi:hypothetical protein G3N59_08180 [Paraburkholderia sp. Ac-20340]|uniref:hypothetical protein n=1 Tax=Paraburkholderia sp. Ac-20340 TaxID=2703888 RepID=UPI00198019A4|nr:hypothetical protein [Paraburkholderia sp. Ac-20340]MBN3853350.1 hypothetical protein [Paraburkholderia sp. Ac-20340]